jgi:hypothetical protein
MISCVAATLCAPHSLPVPVFKQRRPAAIEIAFDLFESLATGGRLATASRAPPHSGGRTDSLPERCQAAVSSSPPNLGRIGDDTATLSKLSTARICDVKDFLLAVLMCAHRAEQAR